MNDMEDDIRIMWLKYTISNLLGVDQMDYVNDMFEKYDEMLDNFLNSEYQSIEDIERVILFCWRTFYDKMIEEEITVLEEGELFHLKF